VPDHPIVHVDFNERDKDGNVLALAENAGALQAGDTAQIRDGEGNTAEAEVVSIGEGLVHFRVNWDTWVPVEDADKIASVTTLIAFGRDEVIGFGSSSGHDPFIVVRSGSADDLLEALSQSMRSSAGASVAAPVTQRSRK
jgi:hypothetical protein